MPVITEKQTKVVEVPVAYKCDCCGKEDWSGINDFVLRHTFGYGSPMDMTSVEAAICDDCLLRIIQENVPGAKFTDLEELYKQRRDR